MNSVEAFHRHRSGVESQDAPGATFTGQPG